MKKGIGMQRKELATVTGIGDEKTMTSTLKELCECGFVRAYEICRTSHNGKNLSGHRPICSFCPYFSSGT